MNRSQKQSAKDNGNSKTMSRRDVVRKVGLLAAGAAGLAGASVESIMSAPGGPVPDVPYQVLAAWVYITTQPDKAAEINSNKTWQNDLGVTDANWAIVWSHTFDPASSHHAEVNAMKTAWCDILNTKGYPPNQCPTIGQIQAISSLDTGARRGKGASKGKPK